MYNKYKIYLQILLLISKITPQFLKHYDNNKHFILVFVLAMSSVLFLFFLNILIYTTKV